MASIFHSITDRTQGVHKSNDWYRRQVGTIASKISASKLMAEGKLLNSPSSGRLNMFFYNPKTNYKKIFLSFKMFCNCFL